MAAHEAESFDNDGVDVDDVPQPNAAGRLGLSDAGIGAVFILVCVAAYLVWIAVLYAGIPIALVGVVLAFYLNHTHDPDNPFAVNRRFYAIALWVVCALLVIASIAGNLFTDGGPFGRLIDRHTPSGLQRLLETSEIKAPNPPADMTSIPSSKSVALPTDLADVASSSIPTSISDASTPAPDVEREDEGIARDLASADSLLNRTWKDARPKFTDEGWIRLRALQRQWIKDRDNTCDAERRCLLTWTKARIEWLSDYSPN